MSDKRADGLSKALGGAAGFAAGYGSRKLVTFAWKQITGKEPPSDPDDPAVSIGEALVWAIVVGVAMETARVVVVRMAVRQVRRGGSGSQ
jgi:hypothetical protein